MEPLFTKVERNEGFVYNEFITIINDKSNYLKLMNYANNANLQNENIDEKINCFCKQIKDDLLHQDSKITLFDGFEVQLNDPFFEELKTYTKSASLYFGQWLDKIIISYFYSSSLFNRLFDDRFKNKLFVLGPGNFYKEIFPDFVIKDIKDNNSFYEITIIEACGNPDDPFETWGCPKYEALKNVVKDLLPNNSNNVKINNILNSPIENYELLYLLNKKTNKDIVKSTIINTIPRGGHLEPIINRLNILYEFIKTNHTDLYKRITINNVIYYVATGSKFIFFNVKEGRFNGFKFSSLVDTIPNCTNKYDPEYNPEFGDTYTFCELDALDPNDLLTNNFDRFQIKYKKLIQEQSKPNEPLHVIVGGNRNMFYIKYLKYKSKYLKLKNKMIE